jgi:hypothetical protein
MVKRKGGENEMDWKKVIMIWVGMIFLAVAVNAGDKAIAPAPKADVKAPAVVAPVAKEEISWDGFKLHRDAAWKLEAEGKLLEAVEEFLKAEKQAFGLGRLDIQAWMLNDAGFMYIKAHKKDSTVDLEKAKVLLEQASLLADATDDCKAKIKSNLDYCDYYLKEKEKNKK